MYNLLIYRKSVLNLGIYKSLMFVIDFKLMSEYNYL